MKQLFNIGIPSPCGGANTEIFDTISLWRSVGIEVTCLYPQRNRRGPVKAPNPSNPYLKRLAEIGVHVEFYSYGMMEKIEGLAGALVTGMCCSHFVDAIMELKALECRTCWSPAMTEQLIYTNALRDYPPDAVHFQSQFQAKCLGPTYWDWGVHRQAVIHGAFDGSLFPFSPLPHKPGEPFVVGRLARCTSSKWPRWLWPMLQAVRDAGVDVRFLGMGWGPELDIHCGPPPDWAECLPENTISAQEFLGKCHALICANSSDRENWPRVGLEAMSSGVPVVADEVGGWLELLTPDSGILRDSPMQYAASLLQLASDEDYRKSLISGGQKRLSEIADPAVIGPQWKQLFDSLEETR